MAFMVRALVLTALWFGIPVAVSSQPLTVLHIKVVLVDAERKAMPVPRHALLISENPASAAPRRVVTALDGTVDVKLRPGNYTIESDQPVAFQGKSYQWTQTLDITAGRDALLELTVDNAEVGPVVSATTSGAASEADPSALLIQWKDSVVALWTPTTHASGFVVDAKGLVATSHRVIGTATSVEVQLTPTVKVAGSVLVADSVRDVAVLHVDPQALESVRAVPLRCPQAAAPPVVTGQKMFTIATPLRDEKGITSGTVDSVQPEAILSNFGLATGSTGGPVFTTDGALVGLTSVPEDADDRDETRHGNSRVVRIADVCDVVASAEKKMKGAAPPNGAHLPVEPDRPFPVNALRDAAQHRAGSLNPYQVSSSDFDIAFITPVSTYGAQYQSEQASRRERASGTRSSDGGQVLVRPLMEFSNWSEYVADFPPVLLVRVTPKLVEGFWTTVARGAARTQGVALPPFKHVKSGFLRMRALCGGADVTPIHPFKLEQRVSENASEKAGIYEGLYVFDPGALGPHCGTVTVVLYSEKEPEKADAKVVDPKVLQQIWQDFEPYRAAKG
jgi:S1-C subfamily serine protease